MASFQRGWFGYFFVSIVKRSNLLGRHYDFLHNNPLISGEKESRQEATIGTYMQALFKKKISLSKFGPTVRGEQTTKVNKHSRKLRFQMENLTNFFKINFEFRVNKHD